jgi:2-polyprenyl-3-methyl-5-hydroxy-6-metoxy-1,4-benzoquinol methylase
VQERIVAAIKKALSKWKNPLVPPPTAEHLEAIRTYEIKSVIPLITRRGRLLEIGAGSGWQARALANCGFEVDAIDLPTSLHAENRIWPVIDYDGVSIPFQKATFDVVFSSNTLEHIPQLFEFQREIKRVLKPDGLVVHIVPSATWRAWTSMTHLVRFLTLPIVHGEHSSNVISEMHSFSRQSWIRFFNRSGWAVVEHRRGGLFYTGCCIADHRLSIVQRERLSRWLGSSVHCFVLHAAREASGVDH